MSCMYIQSSSIGKLIIEIAIIMSPTLHWSKPPNLNPLYTVFQAMNSVTQSLLIRLLERLLTRFQKKNTDYKQIEARLL